jgi:hypothetical protein
MYEIKPGMPPHARATIARPRDGWTRRFYDRQIAQYARDRGAPPRTATLHPETMCALGFDTTWIDAVDPVKPGSPLLVSSTDYARDVITLYE